MLATFCGKAFNLQQRMSTSMVSSNHDCSAGVYLASGDLIILKFLRVPGVYIEPAVKQVNLSQSIANKAEMRIYTVS